MITIASFFLTAIQDSPWPGEFVKHPDEDFNDPERIEGFMTFRVATDI